MSAGEVWVCSEGPRDYGDSAKGEGALLPIVRKVLGSDHTYSAHRLTLHVHGRFGRQRRERPADRSGLQELKGNFKRLAICLRDARRQHKLAVVFVHDLDAIELKKNKRPTHRAALKAFTAARKAAENGLAAPSALGVAVPMVEAWLLGDAEALRRAFDDTASHELTRPERQTTGRGGSRYAKKELEQHLDGRCSSFVESYQLLAQALDLDRVAENCPQSFAPFLEELKKLRTVLNH